uniref:NADH-ubiquinone oxidoreductase chain 4 n=1 Tax=Gordionus wolterstorffii TaxID=190562 RepID=A0A514ABY5_9BILA|nr:NADH dehydrogenase subunit 4 [Gordionus wolterstorffii]
MITSLIFLVMANLKSKYLCFTTILLVLFFNFEEQFNVKLLFKNNTGYAIDKISYFLGLTFLFVLWLILVACSILNFEANKLKMILLGIFLSLILFGTVSTNKLFLFFIFFEVSLVPMSLMIWGWGPGLKKITAGFFLLMYTSIAGAPLLLNLLFIMSKFKILTWGDLSGVAEVPVIFLYGLLVAFCVKLPVYMLHMWLPKAHVEASTTGSMILAGSLLKLGSFGLNRMIQVLMKSPLSLLILLSTLLHGLLVATYVACMLADGKTMIAMSSVSHMTILAGSLLTGSFLVSQNNQMASLTHGLVSPLMFFYFFCVYEPTKSRSVLLVKSTFLNTSHYLILLWFFCVFSNMGCPPFFSFFPEMLSFFLLLQYSFSNWGILMMFSLLMAGLSTLLISRMYLANAGKSSSKEGILHSMGTMNVMAQSMALMLGGWVFLKNS